LLQGRARYHPQASKSLALLSAPDHRNSTANCHPSLKRTSVTYSNPCLPINGHVHAVQQVRNAT
jgi:hypothetical protein